MIKYVGKFGLQEATSQSPGTFTKKKLFPPIRILGGTIKNLAARSSQLQLKQELETSKLDALAAKTGNKNETHSNSRRVQMLEKNLMKLTRKQKLVRALHFEFLTLNVGY